MTQIRFDDGAAYERYMGVWSQRAGAVFLEWLAPGAGRDWLDVGCGNGAFTQLVVDTCAPASVHGIDPSDAQLEYARSRFSRGDVAFQKADAMSLPFDAASFDVAVMPLVIFFVPEPSRGVEEMVRVVRPGGLVAAYAWDMDGGGFPYEVLGQSLRDLGVDVPRPPSVQASRLDVQASLWQEAGLAQIDARTIVVERTFDSFDDYWTTVLGAPSAGRQIASLAYDQRERLQQSLRERLTIDADGRVHCVAQAHAIKGCRRVRQP